MSRKSRERYAAEAAAEANQNAQVASQAPELSLEPADAVPQVQPKDDENTRPPLRNEPRRLAMAEIEARDLRTKGIQDVVTAPVPEAKPEAAAKPETAPAVATPAPESAPAAVAAETPASEPAVKTIKVKVDGQEFDVPQADVEAAGGVTAYQKDKAAENRLNKANQALAETRKTQANTLQWIQQNTSKEPVLTDDQFIASKIDTIRFGTPEESSAALREVLKRSNPAIDQNAITQQAVTIMQRNQALDKFTKEFQDVVTNPVLLRAAVSIEAERMQQTGPQTDWPKFYQTIGNEVRSVTGRPSQPTMTPVVPTNDTTSQSPSDREARKASIVTIVPAAARAVLPTETKPETREDTLNAMRKSRGLPVG